MNWFYVELWFHGVRMTYISSRSQHIHVYCLCSLIMWNFQLLPNSRYPVKYGQNSVSNTKIQSGNYYTKDKTEDFKVFHTIPASSHLLANYDPFYSPLLSRIDTVFKQLGYASEPCRERLVCQMYKSPAKYAPYSNLVSAQLSRSVIPMFIWVYILFP